MLLKKTNNVKMCIWPFLCERRVVGTFLCLMSRLPSSRPCCGDRRSHVCRPTLHFVSSLLSNKNNLIFENENIKKSVLFPYMFIFFYLFSPINKIIIITLCLRLYWVEFLSMFYIMSDQNSNLTSRIYCIIIHGWTVWKCETTIH